MEVSDMESIKFDSNNINPIFIFEYYDTPLAFISDKINGEYYFFYFIDDNQYFIMPLTVKDINLIFSSQYIREVFESFLENDSFKIIDFISQNDATLYSVNEFEEISGEDIDGWLPENNQEFEYDFVNKVSFADLRDSYKDFFPGLFNHKQMTIKMRDEQNSHSAVPSVVLKAIKMIDIYISEKKLSLNTANKFLSGNLSLLPFSPGSFNINFELSLPDEVSLFEDNILDFDDFIIFIDSLNTESAEKIYDDLIYESPKIVKATSEFYKDMKNFNYEIEILDKEQKLSTFKVNPKVDETMERLHVISKARECGREEREILQFSGEVRSASKIRNTISIGLAGGNVSAKFTKELFKEIKDSVKSVAVSKEIRGQWEKISIFDDKNMEVDTRYIIISFEQ